MCFFDKYQYFGSSNSTSNMAGFCATLNKIGIGNTMEVISDGGFVFVFRINTIYILTLLFKYFTINSLKISIIVSIIRDYEILRVYTYCVGKFLQLNITHVLHYDEIFMKILYEPDSTSSELNTVLLNVAIETYDGEYPNDGAASQRDSSPYTESSLPCDGSNPNNQRQCPGLCFCHDQICHAPEACDERSLVILKRKRITKRAKLMNLKRLQFLSNLQSINIVIEIFCVGCYSKVKRTELQVVCQLFVQLRSMFCVVAVI